MRWAAGKQTQSKTMDYQIVGMRQRFPQFKYFRQKGYWIGELQPAFTSYEIKIDYRVGLVPKVYVLKPDIQDDAPHIYRRAGKTLCLYYPYDGSWSSEKLIAHTIVPWTVEWLFYYESWCITDRWFGPEALHTGSK